MHFTTLWGMFVKDMNISGVYGELVSWMNTHFALTYTMQTQRIIKAYFCKIPQFFLPFLVLCDPRLRYLLIAPCITPQES